jgi:hypothetical protein
MMRLRCLLLLVLFIGAMPSLAHADEEAARAHFRKGVELYDRKQYAEALESFKAAYAEKPSAGIKQNIALSLKGLGRVVEAATALDEALDEGQSTLKPETKAAIERELAELSKSVATVHLRVQGADGAPIENAVVTIDGTALPPGAYRRPMRLQQGIHSFNAHVEGFPDPPPKKLALLLGQPVDATFFVTRAGTGSESTLTVRVNVADAIIKVDGTEVGKGEWTGKLSPGSHQLEVSAEGHRTASTDITVNPGAAQVHGIQLTKLGEAPGPYDHVERRPPPPQKLYIAPTIGLFVVGYRLAEPLGEPPSGERRGFGGISLGVRGGYRFSKWIAGELLAEVGVMQSKHRADPGDARDTEVNMTISRFMPVVRMTTPGKVRFVAGTGFGLALAQVDAKVVNGPDTDTKKGNGVGLSWLLDGGMQFDAGPLFLEGVLFLDVHGTGAVKDDKQDTRYLQASPAVRGGLRIGLGIPF